MRQKKTKLRPPKGFRDATPEESGKLYYGVVGSGPEEPPQALDAIVDVVLAYHPKPKTKPARRRQAIRRRLTKSR
jgi:hypothetical protein